MKLVNDLQQRGVEVWIDKNIKPGEHWATVIRRAISEGEYFIACFSNAYISRSKTYMNEELTQAIDQIRLRMSDKIWFIPVRLTECEIPDREIGGGQTISSLQWVDLYKNWTAGIDKILEVVAPRRPKAFNEAVILWIDDNHATNQVYREAWEGQGVKITLADSTNEALQLLENFQFDVIISDLFRIEEGQHRAAGYELLERLSEKHINIPVIIYTTSIEAVDRQRARTAFGIADMPIHVYQLIMAALAGDR